VRKKLLTLFLFICLNQLNAQIISTIAGTGVNGFNGDGIAATTAKIGLPVGIKVDVAGNVFFVDQVNYRVRRVDAVTGLISTVAGSGSSTFSGDGGPATSAGFVNVFTIALDAAGNIYIADPYAQRIRKVTASTGIINTIAGTGLSGYSGDGIPATTAKLYNPTDVAVDAAGNVYIADLFNSRVRKVDAVTGIITTVAGNGTGGYSGDGGAATSAEINDAEYIAIDCQDNLYISDSNNERIRKVAAGTGIITTIAGIGINGFSGDGGPATSAEISTATGIAIDPSGNVFFDDFLNQRIRKIAAGTGIITTIAGDGTSAYLGDGGPATSAEINYGAAIAFDTKGNLYLSDEDNNRIRKITNAGSGNGAVVVNVTPSSPSICKGATVNFTASGGTTYLWSPSNGSLSCTTCANPTATPDSTTTYTIKGAACLKDTGTQTVTVVVNKTPVPSIAGTSTTCSGAAISLTASGASATGTYAWSTGASSATISVTPPLGTTTYTVTVTNGTCPSATATKSVTVGPGITAGASVSTAISCNGGNGTVTATTSGGSANYSYSWSNGSSSVTNALSSPINLPAGNYTVVITDAGGCTNSSTVILTDPPAIAVPTIIPVNASCGNSNGSATASSTGGTGTLTYTWNTLASGATVSGLAAGTYTVTVKDANACAVTNTVAISSTSGTTATAAVTAAINCNGQTGSVTATASSSSSPYTYSWNSGQSSITSSLSNAITSLAPNTYIVTITDANGCSGTSSVALTQPTAISISSVVPTNSNCGGNTGSAIATAAGGTGTLTYTWSNLASGQTNSNLSANTYTLTVTDANSCSTSQTVTINNNGAPTVNSITPADELCNGGSTGTAAVSASGGTGALTYNWSPSGGSAATASGLTAGIYTVTVKDANACQVVSTVTITEPGVVSITTINPTNAKCSLSNGSAVATATGGTGSLTYSWSNLVSGSTASGLSAATYTLTVTDANGCVKSQTVTITNSAGPTISSLTSTGVLCNGGSTGSATLNISGGTSPYTYSWSTGASSITSAAQSTISNQQSSIYTVTVSDANACQQTSTVLITEPPALAINSINSTNTSCNANNGTAVASASGGTGSLTYSWSNLLSGPTASGLPAGNYVLTVTDANGCSSTSTTAINSSNGPTAAASVTTQIKCKGQTGSVTATASNGTTPYTYSWSAGVSGSGFQVSGLAGTYTVTITDANGCTSTSTTSLSEPAAIVITTTKTDAACGTDNGKIIISVTGGTGLYTYTWSTGATQSAISNLKPGTYSLTVTDANACTQIISDSILNNPGPVASIASAQTSITDGSSTLLIGGSSGSGATYSWTPSSSLNCSNCANPLASPGTTTTYTLYVKDSNNCVDSADITITVKQACADDKDIFIANIFSPNSDGKNDVLNVEGNGITNLYWAIYDRWGNLLFETTDQAQGWDGTKNGSAMETGTYVYYLKAVCIKNNAEIKLKGNVSIVK